MGSPCRPLNSRKYIMGAATLTSNVVQAHTGFSDIAMTMTMPSILLVLLWCMCIGVFLLRSAGTVDNAA